MALRRSGVLVRGAPVEWRRIPGIGWPGLAGAAGVASRGGEEGGGRGQAADAGRERHHHLACAEAVRFFSSRLRQRAGPVC
jgi:hypothetical protein